jgi:hypothetical protein
MKTTPSDNFLLLILLTIMVKSILADSTTVNYDTAWTFVYDGGKDKGGRVMSDNLRDVKSYPDGSSVCSGYSIDSLTTQESRVLYSHPLSDKC